MVKLCLFLIAQSSCMNRLNLCKYVLEVMTCEMLQFNFLLIFVSYSFDCSVQVRCLVCFKLKWHGDVLIYIYKDIIFLFLTLDEHFPNFNHGTPLVIKK